MLSVGKTKEQICNFGLWIDGLRILATTTMSYFDCKQKCQEISNCSDWRFYKTQSSCEVYSKITAYQTGYNDYVSGSKLCILPENKHTWGEHKL